MGKGAAAVRGLSLRLAHRFGRQKELPQRCMGKLPFLLAFIGLWVGVLFLLLLDRLIPHLHVGSEQAEGPKSKLGRTTMMVLDVALG